MLKNNFILIIEYIDFDLKFAGRSGMAGALAGLCHIFLKYLDFWFTYFMKNGISLILSLQFN